MKITILTASACLALTLAAPAAPAIAGERVRQGGCPTSGASLWLAPWGQAAFVLSPDVVSELRSNGVALTADQPASIAGRSVYLPYAYSYDGGLRGDQICYSGGFGLSDGTGHSFAFEPGLWLGIDPAGLSGAPVVNGEPSGGELALATFDPAEAPSVSPLPETGGKPRPWTFVWTAQGADVINGLFGTGFRAGAPLGELAPLTGFLPA